MKALTVCHAAHCLDLVWVFDSRQTIFDMVWDDKRTYPRSGKVGGETRKREEKVHTVDQYWKWQWQEECLQDWMDKQNRTSSPIRNPTRTQRRNMRQRSVSDHPWGLFSGPRSSTADTSWCPPHTVTLLRAEGKVEQLWDMILIRWTGHGVKRTNSVHLVLGVWALTPR